MGRRQKNGAKLGFIFFAQRPSQALARRSDNHPVVRSVPAFQRWNNPYPLQPSRTGEFYSNGVALARRLRYRAMYVVVVMVGVDYGPASGSSNPRLSYSVLDQIRLFIDIASRSDVDDFSLVRVILYPPPPPNLMRILSVSFLLSNGIHSKTLNQRSSLLLSKRR
jgi:hypothetical protein